MLDPLGGQISKEMRAYLPDPLSGQVSNKVTLHFVFCIEKLDYK